MEEERKKKETKGRREEGGRSRGRRRRPRVKREDGWCSPVHTVSTRTPSSR
jgi:hypothetical protein